MADKLYRDGGCKEAVCVDAGRVYDSCCDKDCIENWDDHFQNFWSALDDDDIITVVNCHG